MLSSKKTYKMLDFVGFNALVNWSVQYLGDSAIKFSRKYPLMRIGDFLTRNKTGIEIQDNETYKRATIRVRNGGIYLRDTQDGRHIGTKKQFLIKAGQFLLSKIDARNGAFGVVPDELDGGIITGNFWTFDVDYAIINPHYLTLLTTAKQFIDFCEQASNGTTNRHYLQEPLFLNIKVPVPSLEEQNKLVQQYNDIMHFIKLEEMGVVDLAVKVTTSVREALGVALYPGLVEKELIHFGTYSMINSWSVEHILHTENSPFGKSKYLCKRLSELAYINPRTDISMLNDKDELSFIPMEDISDDYGEWVGTRRGSKTNIKGYTKFQDGDIIWARITPCMQNGKSAYVHNLVNGKGFGSTEFHIVRLKTQEVLPEYIHTLLRHDDVLCDAKKYFTGSAGQQRVPASYLENLLIPIPPLDIQKKIADDYINNINLAKAGYQKIDNYRAELRHNIETQIFE